MKNEYDVIEEAIKQKKELLLGIHIPVEGDVEVFLQPYIMGRDIMTLPFVWGYVPEYETFYKAHIDFVYEASFSGIDFELRDDACYLHAANEDHDLIVEGFDDIHSSTAPIKI